MKVKTTANKLTNADVQWVSLVGKPANKIPFKIVKQEKGMIDLDLKTVVAKHQKDLGTNVSAIVTTNDNIAQKTELVKACGYSVENMSEDGDAVVFKQEGFSEETDCFAVKMNEFTVMVPKQKGFESWVSSSDFNDNYAIENVYNGVHDAGYALRKTMNSIMEEASDVEAAKKKIKTALVQHSKFIQGLLDNVPIYAFKLEKEIPKVEKEVETELEDTAKADTGKDQDEGKTDEKAVEKGSEDVKDNVAEDTPTGDAATKAEETPDVKSGDDESKKSLTDELKAMSEIIAGFGLNIDSLGKTLTTQKEDSDKQIAALAKKVSEFGHSVDLQDEDFEQTTVTKSEDYEEYEGGFNFDTALKMDVPGGRK